MDLDRRILEPELMLDPEQVRAYAQADFEEPHSRVLALFQEAFPGPLQGCLLDLGCGTGDITFRFARAYPEVQVIGVDGSPQMLRLALELCPPELAGRVRFVEGLVPHPPVPRGTYAAIVSNSLLHHLHDPAALWSTLRWLGAPGTRVLIVDLRRPASTELAREMVERYAAGEPEILRRDFYNSLLAAFRVEEVAGQLSRAGLGHLQVRPVGDRHLAVWGEL
ncbi:MAG TPA: class I SAM-dependent methyltransferase [Candidatus Nitrosotenuis sp.]|jgi:ubiquinone/menaquinone biosynthesis C-methylase UbiE|nr:class I SAM-dependent methyltransferase [Candidatus Nitrosotenuis sp.]